MGRTWRRLEKEGICVVCASFTKNFELECRWKSPCCKVLADGNGSPVAQWSGNSNETGSLPNFVRLYCAEFVEAALFASPHEGTGQQGLSIS
jgi:hypothetical protein